MKKIVATSKFKKDIEKLAKRGKDKGKLTYVLSLLSKDEALPASFKPHKLKGGYAPKWECHIEPDWLLIYEYDDENLYLARTGTHSDLFR